MTPGVGPLAMQPVAYCTKCRWPFFRSMFTPVAKQVLAHMYVVHLLVALGMEDKQN